MAEYDFSKLNRITVEGLIEKTENFFNKYFKYYKGLVGAELTKQDFDYAKNFLSMVFTTRVPYETAKDNYSIVEIKKVATVLAVIYSFILTIIFDKNLKLSMEEKLEALLCAEATEHYQQIISALIQALHYERYFNTSPNYGR